MKKIKINKRAGYTDIFLFMIVAFVIVVICGVFIYMGITIEDQLRATFGNMTGENATDYGVLVTDVYHPLNVALSSLYWLTLFMIIGMVLAIFVGSYLVTTKPVFFVPYIFIVIIAVIVSVGISNAYETLMSDDTLGSTFQNFIGSNYLLLHLPIWVAVIGITGGIIMFIKMETGGEYYGYG